ncbi:2-C-methyl-D-erythritol 4-phosphate cytidylyltransferase [Intrasporangium oryzae NRRL B-24470]|uniref:2-C-methyl-D-erythritol 4-phosphate cytidylyltransferase n=1 Tax=Intrasporangium oryzae NRRL B-24470 TaxID=1386089 RepID=W9G4T3_9MICO|nr:2-C-methyl-D-erythritol 4-phosphate cytidylyltransferase [Intrasporangium oryzae]EWS99822.1 2-C-methyl-D-erythritol 4-phosphate cytidylyltransferase [Intrasporangium oryzae NRRL B-24470]
MTQSPGVGVILVAAGSGSRLGADVPKAFVPLAGLPILGHALRGALSCPDVAEVVVVAPVSHLAVARELAEAALSEHEPSRVTTPARQAESSTTDDGDVCRPARSAAYVSTRAGSGEPQRRVGVVPGGAERGDSVAAGLAALSPEVSVVLVHDAARCLTPVAVFERVVAAVRAGAPAVVPGTAVVDTIKQVDETGRVVATPERSMLRAVQTPQGFRRDVLERAHALSSDATDDAALVERLGEPVLVVDGDALAFKVTTPADLDAARRILAG